MVLTAAVLAASVFMVALRAMAIPLAAARVVTVGREAARILADHGLGDDEKERLIRGASLALARSFGSIAARTGIALAAALLPLVALQVAGVVDVASVAAALATWPGVLLTSVAMTGLYLVKVGP
jgi:hypothetical protein